MATLQPQDTRRAHLVRVEELSEIVLVHRLRQIRDVEVGVELIGESLQL